MTKAELIDKIAAASDLTKVQADKFLGALTSAITAALVAGDSVTLVGLGTFKVSERKERKGRNPRTREEMIIPAGKAPKFTPGKQLKESVQGK